MRMAAGSSAAGWRPATGFGIRAVPNLLGLLPELLFLYCKLAVLFNGHVLFFFLLSMPQPFFWTTTKLCMGEACKSLTVKYEFLSFICKLGRTRWRVSIRKQ